MAQQPTKFVPGNTNVPAGNATRARETVFVFFKEHLPSLDLQLCEPQTVLEEGKSGNREVTIWYRAGDTVRIRGLSYPVGQTPMGFPDRPHIVAGYSVTRNIDKVFWDKWIEQNKLFPAVVSGNLFAATDLAEGSAKAREMTQHTASSFSPMDPSGDRRTPRPMTQGLTKLQESDELKGRRQRAREDSVEA